MAVYSYKVKETVKCNELDAKKLVSMLDGFKYQAIDVSMGKKQRVYINYDPGIDVGFLLNISQDKNNPAQAVISLSNEEGSQWLAFAMQKIKIEKEKKLAELLKQYKSELADLEGQAYKINYEKQDLEVEKYEKKREIEYEYLEEHADDDEDDENEGPDFSALSEYDEKLASFNEKMEVLIAKVPDPLLVEKFMEDVDTDLQKNIESEKKKIDKEYDKKTAKFYDKKAEDEMLSEMSLKERMQYKASKTFDVKAKISNAVGEAVSNVKASANQKFTEVKGKAIAGMKNAAGKVIDAATAALINEAKKELCFATYGLVDFRENHSILVEPKGIKYHLPVVGGILLNKEMTAQIKTIADEVIAEIKAKAN